MVSKRFWWGVPIFLIGPALYFFWPVGSPAGLTIHQAELVKVYEGLPHPLYEEELFASEAKAKQIFDLYGYPFYCEPLVLKTEDIQRVKAILGDPRSHLPFVSGKKCGGFHPDFAAEWVIGTKKYVCHICFGCAELCYYHSATQNFDLSGGAAEQLKRILAPYRKNRPPHERFGLSSG